MKLGTKGQYAVLAMVDLALHAEEGPVALSLIAARQHMPLQYLEQLFPKLRRVGLVASVRGAKGGYALGKPSTEIAVAEIIAAVDEPIRVMRCRPGSGMGCQGKPSQCLTHALWHKLNGQIVDYLGLVTLAHICARDLPEVRQVVV